MASNGNINCTTNDVVWQFKGNSATSDAAAVTLKKLVFGNYGAHAPPSHNLGPPLPEAEEAVAAAVRSGMANSYAPSPGTSNARRTVADYLNGELPTKLRPEDVYITGGCNQAIEILIDSLAGNPAANILLPNPVYPHYDARAMYSGVKVRKYDLLPERDFEIDLDALEAAADKNTVALVLVNPNNPCGNVYTYDHLRKV
ncbi:probable aminotransferase TAT3 [Raphanus sativus]|uniref:Probable aminotransferase TAT3 n=1 Tax=Raphanus sativus TaxID=3726 RepID=A0A6J0N3L7_RAPSA|nr:probable aminotransferase TAT3 [Raphanus sativus]